MDKTKDYKILYNYLGKDHVLAVFALSKLSDIFSQKRYILFEKTLIGHITTKALEYPNSDKCIYRVDISQSLRKKIELFSQKFNCTYLKFVPSIILKGSISHGREIIGNVFIGD